MKKINKLKICLLAPSGSGKSTIANFLVENFNAEIIKLATPLYEIQSLIYSKLNIKIDGQDGELLQLLGNRVQQENPEFLFNEFNKKVKSSTNKIIINDDCRPHNYPFLKKEGFIFIKIVSEINRLRNKDISKHNLKNSIEWNPKNIPFDYTIENNGNLEKLEANSLKIFNLIAKNHSL